MKPLQYLWWRVQYSYFYNRITNPKWYLKRFWNRLLGKCPACGDGVCESQSGKGIRFIANGCTNPPPCDPIIEPLFYYGDEK